jgi:hypothetical protein
MDLVRAGLGDWNDGDDTIKEKRERRHRRSFRCFSVLSPGGMKQKTKTDSKLIELGLTTDENKSTLSLQRKKHP